MEAMEANPVPGEQICGAKQDQHGMVLLCSGMGGTTLSAYAALLKERGVEMEVPQIEAGLRFFAIGADKGCSPPCLALMPLLLLLRSLTTDITSTSYLRLSLCTLLGGTQEPLADSDSDFDAG